MHYTEQRIAAINPSLYKDKKVLDRVVANILTGQRIDLRTASCVPQKYRSTNTSTDTVVGLFRGHGTGSDRALVGEYLELMTQHSAEDAGAPFSNQDVFDDSVVEFKNELWLAKETVFRQILKNDRSDFAEKERALNFIKTVLQQLDDHDPSLPKKIANPTPQDGRIHANIKSSLKPKMSTILDEALTSGYSKEFANKKITYEGKNYNVFALLYKKGLLDETDIIARIQKGPTSNPGYEFAMQVYKHIHGGTYTKPRTPTVNNGDIDIETLVNS
jgi:hypothetical protein